MLGFFSCCRPCLPLCTFFTSSVFIISMRMTELSKNWNRFDIKLKCLLLSNILFGKVKERKKTKQPNCVPIDWNLVVKEREIIITFTFIKIQKIIHNRKSRCHEQNCIMHIKIIQSETITIYSTLIAHQVSLSLSHCLFLIPFYAQTWLTDCLRSLFFLFFLCFEFVAFVFVFVLVNNNLHFTFIHITNLFLLHNNSCLEFELYNLAVGLNQKKTHVKLREKNNNNPW